MSHLGLPPHLGSGVFVYKGEELRFLAMPRYSRSFESYRVECGGKVEPHIALRIARQCTDCLRYMQDQVSICWYESYNALILLSN